MLSRRSCLKLADERFDHGWFVFIAWPVMVPDHVLRTRGIKGCGLLVGVIALFVASYVVALAVYAVLSSS